MDKTETKGTENVLKNIFVSFDCIFFLTFGTLVSAKRAIIFYWLMKGV